MLMLMPTCWCPVLCSSLTSQNPFGLAEGSGDEMDEEDMEDLCESLLINCDVN